MEITILTIFPEMFCSPFSESMIKKAQEKGIIRINLENIRDFANDKHKTVDDYSYGGGPGMVFKPEPVISAVDKIKQDKAKYHKTKTIITSPQGKIFNQEMAKKLSVFEHIIFVCGRYEGIDERIFQKLEAEAISIGDYVMTGGEFAVMVMVDVIIRMIPGVLGKQESMVNDSFYDGLLDYPHYTRPVNYKGYSVPEVLLSGNHKEIEKWRKKQSIIRTLKRRPDLLKNRKLSQEEIKIINDYQKEDHSHKEG